MTHKQAFTLAELVAVLGLTGAAAGTYAHKVKGEQPAGRTTAQLAGVGAGLMSVPPIGTALGNTKGVKAIERLYDSGVNKGAINRFMRRLPSRAWTGTLVAGLPVLGGYTVGKIYDGITKAGQPPR